MDNFPFIPNEMDFPSTVPKSEWEGGPPTPSNSLATTAVSQNINRVSDPNTFEGQQIGALLSIKRTPPKRSAMESEIGDIVRVVSHANAVTNIYNTRTHIAESLHWAQFFPLQVGDFCTCPSATCRCIKADPTAYVQFMQYIQQIRKDRAAETTAQRALDADIKISDPNTMEGQRCGAVLAIKQKPVGSRSLAGFSAEVGDLVKMLPHHSDDSRVVKVQNLRTAFVHYMLWDAVFPVGVMGSCECAAVRDENCRCVYVGLRKDQ